MLGWAGLANVATSGLVALKSVRTACLSCDKPLSTLRHTTVLRHTAACVLIYAALPKQGFEIASVSGQVW